MNVKLRRTHRIMWFLLAIGLPIGFVAALQLNRIPPIQEQLISQPLAPALPILIKAVDKPGISVNLRREAQSSMRQLELVVRQPLEVPSIVVRVGTGANPLAVGTLEVSGVYRFPLPDSSSHPAITLVDEIHHTTLQTIHF
ncbi:hypothetical protein [Spirosoma endbachense]|uniref:Uncharacterized protein n=1 Tax=Spirosoma endbachense TaxID=2666025 RepID=A0A6P1W6X8_9BACT|nr:hypothetical protein [Spirosoma endbachense]QHV99779.1 hypothetical protein GJR95_34320 [Spirosoma endbachense]